MGGLATVAAPAIGIGAVVGALIFVLKWNMSLKYLYILSLFQNCICEPYICYNKVY